MQVIAYFQLKAFHLRNYYDILGISEEAGQREIKTAFKKLAMLYHPDKHRGDPEMEERFKEVNMAYQVLSNPVKKANYDYRLKYSVPTYNAMPPRPPYQRPRYPGRPAAPDFTKEDLRRNTLGTMWAFGLSLLLATIVMGAMKAYNYYQDQKLMALLQERRIVYNSAVIEKNEGNTRKALDILSSFHQFYKTEEDIKSFKESLLRNLIEEGDRQFEQGQYYEALDNYQIAAPHLIYLSFDFRHRMARCYQETRQAREALDIYKGLLKTGLQKRMILMNMAQIYRDDLRDYEESLHIFNQAANLAIDNYISTFGEAYLILIHAGNVPEEDFDIFIGEARAYLLAGNVEQSLHETKWLANIWPRKAEVYILRAECYRAMGFEDLACENLALATRIEPLPDNVIPCFPFHSLNGAE